MELIPHPEDPKNRVPLIVGSVALLVLIVILGLWRSGKIFVPGSAYIPTPDVVNSLTASKGPGTPVSSSTLQSLSNSGAKPTSSSLNVNAPTADTKAILNALSAPQ